MKPQYHMLHRSVLPVLFGYQNLRLDDIGWLLCLGVKLGFLRMVWFSVFHITFLCWPLSWVIFWFSQCGCNRESWKCTNGSSIIPLVFSWQNFGVVCISSVVSFLPLTSAFSLLSRLFYGSGHNLTSYDIIFFCSIVDISFTLERSRQFSWSILMRKRAFFRLPGKHLLQLVVSGSSATNGLW